MLLQSLGQFDGIVLVVRLERAPEGYVVLLLDEQVVVRLVDNGDVELLRADEVWLGEGEVVGRLEDFDDSAVVEPGSKGGEEVGEEVGLDFSKVLLKTICWLTWCAR